MRLVQCAGGQGAAKARLAAKGWAPMEIMLGPARIEAMSKGYATVAFDPSGDYASEPLGGIMPPMALPGGDPLREEAMDCLCGTEAD